MLPSPRPLLQEVHCPGSPTSSRGCPPRPLPVRLVRRPAGTRLPIPYMDKCVQAKSGIQAPDVSLQRSGHRTGDRGKGVGRKEGRAPTSSHSRPAAEVSLFVCGFAPRARSSFPGISSVSGGESRPLQGKGQQRGRARRGRGLGDSGRCGPRAGPGQWEGECPAPPPPPEPPPPAVAAAAARSTSSPRYCSKGFLP